MSGPYDMIEEVRQHPDTVWATVFTWDDVDSQREELATEYEHVAAITDAQVREHRHEFASAIERACMDGGDWTEAIKNVLQDIAEPPKNLKGPVREGFDPHNPWRAVEDDGDWFAELEHALVSGEPLRQGPTSRKRAEELAEQRNGAIPDEHDVDHEGYCWICDDYPFKTKPADVTE